MYELNVDSRFVNRNVLVIIAINPKTLRRYELYFENKNGEIKNFILPEKNLSFLHSSMITLYLPWLPLQQLSLLPFQL